MEDEGQDKEDEEEKEGLLDLEDKYIVTEEDFTNKFVFLERVEKGDKFTVKEVKDHAILEVLSKNIKLD